MQTEGTRQIYANQICESQFAFSQAPAQHVYKINMYYRKRGTHEANV